jgi:hypothetical protein
MRYWIGAFTFALALALVGYALARRRQVLSVVSEEALTRRLEQLANDPQSLSAFGEIMRPIVWFALAVIGIKSTIAYFWIGGSRILSPFDLAGVLAMLAAYGYFIHVQTRYRLSAVEVVADAGPADGTSAELSRPV